VPTALATLHGNPSKTPPRTAEPKPAGVLDSAPAWLSDDQKAGWTYALRNAPPGMLRNLDRGILAVWVIAEDLHRQATHTQNQLPSLMIRVKTKSTPEGGLGFMMASPYIGVINAQAKVMLKAASELGFSPVSRPRVFMAPATGEGADDNGATPGSEEKRTLDAFLSADPDASPTIQ